MKSSYPFKHWLASILLGPVLWILSGLLYHGAPVGGILNMLYLCLMYGLVFSLPMLAIYLPLFWLLSKLKLPPLLIKLLLSGIVITGMMSPFLPSVAP